MSESERTPYVLVLSLFESLLLIVLMALLIGGLGLGAGFYLGHQTSTTGEVLSLCHDLSDAQEQRAHALLTLNKGLETRLQSFETFLVDTGLRPTLPLGRGPGAPVRHAPSPGHASR